MIMMMMMMMMMIMTIIIIRSTIKYSHFFTITKTLK